MTTSQFIEKAKQLHNDKYDYSSVDYVNSRTKVQIRCPEHGLFEQLPSSHLQGNGCPACARVWTEEHRRNLQEASRKSRGMITDEWIERAKAVHGDKYDYSQTVYVNQRTNVRIICPIHGVFEQKADSHIRGCGCRLCGHESENRFGVHNWSDEHRQKIKETCLKRYGAVRYLDSDVGKKRISDIKSSADFRKKMSDIISSDVVQEKIKKTCIEHYGVEFPAQTKEVQDKIYKTKKLNHTVSSSKAEILANDILRSYYGKDDVRYPFVCDFYIKSIDLFIEFNLHWSHNHHFYIDTDADDLSVLADWKEKAVSSDYYRSAIETWTVRDVKKRETAIKNNLNYVVFWEKDLSDFKEWLNADKLILNNIL